MDLERLVQVLLQLGEQDVMPPGVLQRQLHMEPFVRVHQPLVRPVVLPHIRQAVPADPALDHQDQGDDGNGK